MARLKVFHVVGTVRGYDTFSDFVCVAESEQAARETFPRSEYSDDNGIRWTARGWEYGDGSTGNQYGEWDDDITKLTVTEIGNASPGSKPSVVCASFRAG